MSPSEIVWRVGSLSRDWVDRGRFTLGWFPKIDDHGTGESIHDVARGFSIERQPDSFRAADAQQRWLPELIAAAENVANGKLSFFAHSELELGDPIDWHKDHHSGIQASRRLIQRVDYRDLAVNGDCKEVWEPNRHHQFVVLARAYAASGEHRFAGALADQMCSWIRQNPFGYGMNWRSPLELGVRMINWIFAIELIRDSGVLDGPVWKNIYSTIYLHCWEISRKLSRGSSANNHLVGEVAGLFVATSYFPDMPNAKKWREIAMQAMQTEILQQSYADGCTREQALGYQFFVIQFYATCGLVGKWSGNDFSAEYWSRLAAMFEFVAEMSQFGPLPLFGDQDDGYVLNLGEEPRDVAALMDVGRYLFSLSSCATAQARPSQSAYWLFDADAPKLPCKLEDSATNASKAYAESGYFLLQHQYEQHRVSIMFDCAELGYGAIAAHGHADALSFSLRIDEEYVLIDPGTYDYFTYPEYRNYFRSTAAHNTVRVDGQDQSELLGPFMWGQQATTTCRHFSIDGSHSTICADHDGYHRLADPVTHRRTIRLDNAICEFVVDDQIETAGSHLIEVFFHFGPNCEVTQLDNNQLRIVVADEILCEFHLDESLEIKSYRGSVDPIAGWYSPGYHQKNAITTIVGSAQVGGDHTLQHRFRIAEGDS